MSGKGLNVNYALESGVHSIFKAASLDALSITIGTIHGKKPKKTQINYRFLKISRYCGIFMRVKGETDPTAGYSIRFLTLFDLGLLFISIDKGEN